MVRLVISIVFIFIASFAQDLERPSSPSDYRSGHFIMNAAALTAGDWASWFKPGNDFCRVSFGGNCDATSATPAQISSALSTWAGMAQCDRLRIRLYNESTIKKDHSTNGERQAWIYFTGIPISKVAAIQSCLTNSFRFLGVKFSSACAAANALQGGLCASFWSGSEMNRVVFGWESDAE